MSADIKAEDKKCPKSANVVTWDAIKTIIIVMAAVLTLLAIIFNPGLASADRVDGLEAKFGAEIIGIRAEMSSLRQSQERGSKKLDDIKSSLDIMLSEIHSRNQ